MWFRHGTKTLKHRSPHFNDQILESLQQTCPCAKQKPKKPCIDEATWQHRTQKLIARRGLRQLSKHCRGEILRACFQAWHSREDYDIDRFWQYRRWLLCANVKLMARHHTHAKQLKRRLQARKTTYLRQTFESLSPDAPASSILHELKKVVGSTNLRSIKHHTLPMVRNSELLCTSPGTGAGHVDPILPGDGGWQKDGT